MKIIIINPILYTSETSNIKKINSIKDSMIYNLCLEFKRQGHEPVLIAAKDYEPLQQEHYDFEVVFLETQMKSIFKPHCLPYMKGLQKYINSISFDFIITSEVFSMNSLLVSRKFKKKTIVWHELAKHNNILKKIPSKVWYNVVARIFFHNTIIVARSENARLFISKYCNNVCEYYIDHGVDLKEFSPEKEKNNNFIVVSQLIKRKHIDGIIDTFSKYYRNNKNFSLYIIGSGEEETNLKKIVKSLKLEKAVVFYGQLSHKDIVPLLRKSTAMIINTEKDNSMLTIVEAIACGTPVLTTNIPYNCDYIIKNKLGIVFEKLDEQVLKNVTENVLSYSSNCIDYRYYVSNEYHVKQFTDLMKSMEEK